MKREWLIKLRGKKTQQEMANLWGITKQSYWFYEYNKRTPRPEDAKEFGKISKFNYLRFYK